ncbi:MAG: hypothetical protein GY757_34580 [bacterium]|nr:hypothetical protein [bacterium]
MALNKGAKDIPNYLLDKGGEINTAVYSPMSLLHVASAAAVPPGPFPGIDIFYFFYFQGG